MTTSNYLPDHYSYALNPFMLQQHAEAREIEMIERVTIPDPVLVFTGFSGIALATALSIELNKRSFKFHMLIVRKPNEAENCHGREIQSSISRIHKNCYFIFVDDFIDSGKTLTRMDKVVEQFGGIKLVCTNHRIDSIDMYVKSKLSSEDVAYYSRLIEVESE